MRIAVYSPYLDIFGGGERYMMTIAEIFSRSNKVDVLLDQHLDNMGSALLKEDLSKRFALDLAKVNFIAAPVGKNSSFFLRILCLNKYDTLFYLTDGSIFYPFAKRNFLHIQSPLVGQPAKNWWGKVKLKGWDLIIYNSEFTQENSLENWPAKSVVIYPPVDVKKIKPLKKEKYILSVGRFFGYLKDKKHGLLIEAFKSLFKDAKPKDWSLHLAGSASDGDIKYLSELQSQAKGFPITFYPNIEYKDLIKLYGQASIYWHAAGYQEDDPTKMEHFGIATVEAMAGGCIPVVINRGGQTEIVGDDVSGYLWDSLEKLRTLTIKLIHEEDLRKRLSQNALNRSKYFSKNKFTENILRVSNLLNKIEN